MKNSYPLNSSSGADIARLLEELATDLREAGYGEAAMIVDVAALSVCDQACPRDSVYRGSCPCPVRDHDAGDAWPGGNQEP